MSADDPIAYAASPTITNNQAPTTTTTATTKADDHNSSSSLLTPLQESPTSQHQNGVASSNGLTDDHHHDNRRHNNGQGRGEGDDDGGGDNRKDVYDYNNADADGEATTDEDLLSPCPCEIVPPIGAVTASCPPEVLAVSLTDSCHSQSHCSSATESSNTTATVVMQTSLTDSVSSATLVDDFTGKMVDSCDSVNSMERSQEAADTLS